MLHSVAWSAAENATPSVLCAKPPTPPALPTVGHDVAVVVPVDLVSVGHALAPENVVACHRHAGDTHAALDDSGPLG